MKSIATIFTLILCISAKSQIDITGDWQTTVSYPPVTSTYERLSITFNLKVDANNKITGTSIYYYPKGIFCTKTFSGKFNKKKDGFHIEEDNLVNKNFSGKLFVYLDRYDFDLTTATNDELNGTNSCLRSLFSATFCHTELAVKLTRVHPALSDSTARRDTTTIHQ